MWNQEKENTASNPTMMTEDYVQENLNNEGFVKCAHNNARLMSDTTIISNEKIKIDSSNISHHVHTSDIAYAVMQRVNNKMVWKAEWEQKNKSSGRVGNTRDKGGGEEKGTQGWTEEPMGGLGWGKKHKGKGSTGKESEEETGMVEAEEVQQGACKKRWTVRGNMAYGGGGLSAEGVAFYGRMLRSMKAINFEEEE